jgi:hypothetical protein
MDIFWWIIAALFGIVVIGGGIWIGLRNHPLSRAEQVDPDTARELREVQRQIDQGHYYDGL